MFVPREAGTASGEPVTDVEDTGIVLDEGPMGSARNEDMGSDVRDAEPGLSDASFEVDARTSETADTGMNPLDAAISPTVDAEAVDPVDASAQGDATLESEIDVGVAPDMEVMAVSGGVRHAGQLNREPWLVMPMVASDFSTIALTAGWLGSRVLYVTVPPTWGSFEYCAEMWSSTPA